MFAKLAVEFCTDPLCYCSFLLNCKAIIFFIFARPRAIFGKAQGATFLQASGSFKTFLREFVGPNSN